LGATITAQIRITDNFYDGNGLDKEVIRSHVKQPPVIPLDCDGNPALGEEISEPLD